ncbi:uncharacterized protein OCT59_011806 [Rhizophagus irregularis]|nr:hypothetical protein OCT59_011806 [Rhizophagus irregularis]GBC39458.2 kinase-like domain-containing protein [Rhizophagus irregularis DAOM 181602=DAOM 197198]
MKKCWDLDPFNRPTIITLENIISEWIKCINRYYAANSDGNYLYEVPDINNQLKIDMLEFIEGNEALVQEQEQENASIIKFHPQACYTSRKLTEIYFQEESQDFDSMIID